MTVGAFFEVTKDINFFLNYACTGVALAAIFLGVLIYSSKSIKSQGLPQGVLLSFVLILEIVIAILIFWLLPIPFVKLFRYAETESIVRWTAIALIVIAHFSSQKHSEKRGLNSAILHLVILGIGWFVNRWVGIFLFSLPLLGIFYYAAYRIALVVIPASKPEDAHEKNQRTLVFLSYVWGLQMPLWNVTAINAKEAEKKIDGKPSLPFFPGMIRTDSHQVVGIMNGNTFRVEGPGVIFTRKGDQPFEVVDLRNQTRTSKIRAFSREGIPFLADVSVTFAIDREEWALGVYHQLGHVNPFLKDGKELNHNKGRLFPYSQARVKAALSFRSRRAKFSSETECWDDHVLAAAEQAVRETLAERSIKDLWQARENENSNASEAITKNIKNLIENPLREKGIRLLNAKTSGFIFSDQKERDKKDEVIEQQIATWSVERERELEIARADALAEAERIEQEARVYARSVLLTAITEGLEQAQEHHPEKDQEAIAQVYLDALKNMIDQQSDVKYKSEAIEELRKERDKFLSRNSGK